MADGLTCKRLDNLPMRLAAEKKRACSKAGPDYFRSSINS